MDDDDLPPTYTEAVVSSHNPTTNSISSNGSLPTSPLASHLQTLLSQMRAAQQAHATSQATRDLELLTLIVPHVETFLSDLGSSPQPPSVAELTLVPAGVVPRGSIMSGAVERRHEGEVVRIARVEAGKLASDPAPADTTTSGRGEKGGHPSRSKRYDDDGNSIDEGDAHGYGPSGKKEKLFDDWGRFETEEPEDGGASKMHEWWFRDEDMARRLAAHLSPAPNLTRKKVQATVERRPLSGGGGGGANAASSSGGSSSGSSGWRWGRQKAKQRPPSPVQRQQQQQQQTLPTPFSPVLSEGGDDRVSMSVRAEEVTFQRENNYGLYESLNGYGIVVKVRVKRPQS